MKTIAKTLIAASILMLSMTLFVTNNSAAPLNGGKIVYVVTIHAPFIDHKMGGALPFNVTLTGDDGSLIGSQRVLYGVATYVFYEAGPVRGIRTATLEATSPSGGVPFYCAPDSKKGTFMPGDTYNFDLWPSYAPVE